MNIFFLLGVIFIRTRRSCKVAILRTNVIAKGLFACAAEGSQHYWLQNKWSSQCKSCKFTDLPCADGHNWKKLKTTFMTMVQDNNFLLSTTKEGLFPSKEYPTTLG